MTYVIPEKRIDYASLSFEDHYQNYLAETGKGFGYYDPAYHEGYDLAYQEEYVDKSWEEIEDDVQQQWNARYPDHAWDDVKDAIRHAWQRVRNTFPQK